MADDADTRNEVSIHKMGMYDSTDITLKSKSDSIDDLIKGSIKMNIIKRFFNSFESNIESTNADTMIENTKRNVPWQIWQHNNHGITIQGTTPKYEFVDNKRISTYECGCRFEEGLKTFGWSGHWCDKHARRTEFGSVVQPIKQTNVDE